MAHTSPMPYQCVAARCSALQSQRTPRLGQRDPHMSWSTQRVAACCSVFLCDAVCCSALQCDTVTVHTSPRPNGSECVLIHAVFLASVQSNLVYCVTHTSFMDRNVSWSTQFSRMNTHRSFIHFIVCNTINQIRSFIHLHTHCYTKWRVCKWIRSIAYNTFMQTTNYSFIQMTWINESCENKCGVHEWKNNL